MTVHERELAWEGCLYVRDLGGQLTDLEKRYGSVEAYLCSAGLSDEDVELARARLRG